MDGWDDLGAVYIMSNSTPIKNSGADPIRPYVNPKKQSSKLSFQCHIHVIGE